MKLRNKLLIGACVATLLGVGAVGAATNVVPSVPAFEPGPRLIDGSKLNLMLNNVNELIVSQASDSNLPSSASAQSAFQNLTSGAVNVRGTTAYLIDLQYIITNTGITSHTWAVLLGGTATLTSGGLACDAAGLTSSAVGADNLGWTSTLGTAFVITAASTSATENVIVQCYGRVNINAAGTLIPQVQSSAATGQTALMKVGSYFRIQAIGNSPTIAVGPWN